MKATPLLQVSLAISPEAADAVTELWRDVLHQSPAIYTATATGRTTATVFFEPNSAWTPALRAELKTGLRRLRNLGIDVGAGRITTKFLKRENWAESWKRHFRPMTFGTVLLVKPSWSRRRPRKKQATVILDPGLSFGTGQHATTSFCLEQLVRCRHRSDAQSFLDIGTGSGILAIAAAKLGFAPVNAFDFDPASVRVALANARRNRVSDRVHFSRRDLTKLPRAVSRRYDLVCANLGDDLLLGESTRITARVKSGGALVLAGILTVQFPRVQQHYEALGWVLAASRVEKEWKSGRFTAPVKRLSRGPSKFAPKVSELFHPPSSCLRLGGKGI